MDRCAARCRLARRLFSADVVTKFPIFDAEKNADGEPTGEYTAAGFCYGYAYSKKSSSGSFSIGIPAHKVENQGTISHMMLLRCDLCDCGCPDIKPLSEGQYVEVNGEKLEALSIVDNRGITATVQFK